MEELRLERRDGDRVIVSNNSGSEYVLVADESLLAEIRSAVRAARGVKGVNPAEIQRLIREGKNREEVAEITGAEDSDIERYEGPVLAERNFILSQAHAVPVRTDSRTEEEDLQKFGEVLAERLIGINAQGSTWEAWRDSEIGWMIALEFQSHDIDHRAVWSFDHRKRLLSPVNSDAVSLSKQNDPGDRLIPKLRAVDHAPEPQDEPAAEPQSELVELDETDAETDVQVSEDEYARRQNIDQLAVTTTSDAPRDLGETQDLLEELRRRRGEREQQPDGKTNALFSAPGVTGGNLQDEDQQLSFTDERSLDSAADNSAQVPRTFDAARKADEPELFSDGTDIHSVRDRVQQRRAVHDENDSEATATTEQTQQLEDSKRKKRGRASIPSWDDILFGTRSEDDPA